MLRLDAAGQRRASLEDRLLALANDALAIDTDADPLLTTETLITRGYKLIHHGAALEASVDLSAAANLSARPGG